MCVVVTYAILQLKRYFRTPVSLVWMLLFPLVVFMIFARAQIDVMAGGALPYASETAYAGFLMMGIIGLSVASTGLFGLSIILVQARDLGILRRLALTPQPAWKFIAGQMIASGIMVLLITFLLLLVGTFGFGVEPPHRPMEWSLVLTVGIVAFLSLGYALAASIREVRTAQVVANVVFLFCLLVGDVWLPLSALPGHFQRLGYQLPLAHLLEALRAVGLQGQPLTDHLSALTVLVVWSLFMTLTAAVQFRWSAAQ